MSIQFQYTVTGDAVMILGKAAKGAREAIMRAVLDSAHDVQRRAKINVKGLLNTTGGSKGTLGRSITVVPNAALLEAAIGPSVIYGRIHEFGGTIRPKKGRFLVFTIGGGALRQAKAMARKFRKRGGDAATARGMVEEAEAGVQLVFARHVTIPAMPYLRPALDAATPAMDKRFERILKPLFD